MERVSPRVEIVEDDLDNVVVFKDVGIGVDAIDGGVVGGRTSGEGSVEGWDRGTDVGDVVEECAIMTSQSRLFGLEGKKRCLLVGSVSKIVHRQVQVKGVVDRPEKLYVIRWDELEIVEFVEFVQKSRRW